MKHQWTNNVYSIFVVTFKIYTLLEKRIAKNGLPLELLASKIHFTDPSQPLQAADNADRYPTELDHKIQLLKICIFEP